MIAYTDCAIKFSETFSLERLNWQVSPGDAWAIVGPNGSGKSALAASLKGEGTVTAGNLELDIESTAILSLEAQGRLIERERLRDDSDITDKVNPGTPVHEMLDEACEDHALKDQLIETLGLTPLLDRGFRKLSTGETRKVLLTRCLTGGANYIVLDEPFEGLDVQTVPRVEALLTAVARKTTLVMVFNRLDEIPDFVSHVLRLDSGSIAQQFPSKNAAQARTILRQLSQISATDIKLPKPEAEMAVRLNTDGSLINLKEGRVAYTDNLVFEQLNWEICPGHHWQVKGPNGSGKTCLLNLVTGDHPQCYVNDLSIFGFRRGQGETIWDIKHYLGYVSTALHWDYRLSVSLIKVIVSGFYDSIGLYSKATDTQLEIGRAWLKLLGLDGRDNDSFASLSYGEQRMLLIARAMVKHPPLLLLDEPCLGLDEANRTLVLALIDRICDEGATTLVYVTHHEEDKIQAIENVLDLGSK